MKDIQIVSVDVQPTTDLNLPTFDNTKLVAVNTCPLWGIGRYSYHKVFPGGGRAMALEAGGAAHEVFAAHRLYSLREYAKDFYGMDSQTTLNVFTETGRRIFGDERFTGMVRAVDEREDFRTRCQTFSLTSLYNCGFYDDPGDKRRTMTNIEEMCIAYMDRRDWKDCLPIVTPNDDGTYFVGIEIPVDVTIHVKYKKHGVDKALLVRLIGKADGIHWKDRDMQIMRVHENKTASRLDMAWEMSWETNHQPTGYMIALSAMLNHNIDEAMVLGSCLPMPKSYAINGLTRLLVTRKKWQIVEWFEWFVHTVDLHNDHVDNPLTAPMYTHSCNRYFRPCSYITLCASEPEERKDIFEEMETKEWSPLHIAGEMTDE